MKKLLLTLVMILNIAVLFSQDRIVKLNTEEISCKIIEVNGTYIKYSYPNEDLVNTISKNIVKELILASGRVQQISEEILISGELDWEKVTITNQITDIEGLVRGKELVTKASSGFSAQSKTLAKAREKMKKLAARGGYHVVYISTTTGTKAGHGSKSSISGFGYKY